MSGEERLPHAPGTRNTRSLLSDAGGGPAPLARPQPFSPAPAPTPAPAEAPRDRNPQADLIAQNAGRQIAELAVEEAAPAPDRRAAPHHRGGARAPRRAGGAARGAGGTYFTREELLARRFSYHDQPRCTLTEPPLLYQTPILDHRPYLQPLCYPPLVFPCCMENENRRAYFTKPRPPSALGGRDGSNQDIRMADLTPRADALDEVAIPVREGRDDRRPNPLLTPSSSDQQPQQGYAARPVAGAAHDRLIFRHGELEGMEELPLAYHRGRAQQADQDPRQAPRDGRARGADSDAVDGCFHLLQRCFCLRCTIATQTDMLFREEERRQRYPIRFCAEWFFGREGHYPRTLITILLCDLLSGGLFIPCGFSYQGLGTACYGWRARYLIRCRYNIFAVTLCDLFFMLFLPMLAVDQQGVEMAANGLVEPPGICGRTTME